jgi:hypothetical protein
MARPSVALLRDSVARIIGDLPMLVGIILVALGVLGLFVVHFQLLDRLFRERRAKQPPVTIERE